MSFPEEQERLFVFQERLVSLTYRYLTLFNPLAKIKGTAEVKAVKDQKFWVRTVLLQLLVRQDAKAGVLNVVHVPL